MIKLTVRSRVHNDESSIDRRHLAIMRPRLSVGMPAQSLRALKQVDFMLGALQRPRGAETSAAAADDGDSLFLLRHDGCEGI